MSSRQFYESYPRQIKNIIMGTRHSTSGDINCNLLPELMHKFRSENKEEFDEFVFGRGRDESILAMAIAFAEPDKCTCLDEIRKFDGGKLYKELVQQKFALRTGDEPTLSAKAFAKEMGAEHCFPETGGGKSRKRQGRKFFKRKTKRKRMKRNSRKRR